MTKELSIVICGQAGQGIKTVESLLTGIMKQSGLHVFSSKEFMSRIRGGMNSTSIRVSSGRVRGFVEKMDILIPLDPGGIEHVRERISTDTLIIGDLETQWPRRISQRSAEAMMKARPGGKQRGEIVSIWRGQTRSGTNC